LEPDVEPHRRVERRLLINEEVLEVVRERLQIVLAREVLLRARPHRDRVHDPADQLLDALLALRRADLSAEIFRDDDVGRLLRPEAGDLDVALLEDDFTFFGADDRGARLPFDLVERIDAFGGEETFVLEARDCRLSRGPRSGLAGRLQIARTDVRARSASLHTVPPRRPADTSPAAGPVTSTMPVQRVAGTRSVGLG